MTNNNKDRWGKIAASWTCAFAIASMAAAQERGVAFTTAGGQTIEFMAGTPEAGPRVTGAPYSAEATTTVTQTLADGTRIERVSTTRMFRDGEGRTRREQTVQGLGPLNASGETTVITIVDPVARVGYVLDPISRKARRADLRQNILVRKVEEIVGQRQVEEGRRVERSRGAGPGEPPPAPAPTAVIDPLAPPPPPPPPGAGARGRGPGGAVPNQPQPLGTRQIEGVDAVGTKRVEVIPAGRIGNDRPIEILDERWESPALKVLVQSRHSDPRTGVVEYRLTNISRAEPAHDFFVVPPDYTIVEARNEERR